MTKKIKMSNSYTILSKYYDKLIYDSEYQQWVDYVAKVVKEYAKSKKGVDVACGTGIFTRALKKSGFDVAGIDLSQEMLEKAINLTVKENLSITYLKQNMKNLKLFEKVGFITCINDGLNYLNGVDFEKAIKSFSSNLLSGGLLLFDISSKYKLENVLSNNMYGDNSEDLSYIWFNTKNDDSVEINVQYVHSLEFVTNVLEKNNFNIVKVTGELGKDLNKNSLRQIFIAIKK